MKKKIVIISSLVVIGVAVLIAYTNATVVRQGVRCDDFIEGYMSACEVFALPQGAAQFQYLKARLWPRGQVANNISTLPCPFGYSDPGVEKIGGVGPGRYSATSGITLAFEDIVIDYTNPTYGVVLRKNGEFCIGAQSEPLTFPRRYISTQENINIQRALRSIAGSDDGNYQPGAADIRSGVVVGCWQSSSGNWNCHGLSNYLRNYYADVNISNSTQFCTKAYRCIQGREPDISGMRACLSETDHGRGNVFVAQLIDLEFEYSLRYRRWMNGDFSGCVASAPQPPNPPPPTGSPPVNPPPIGSCSGGYWRLSACSNNCSRACERKPGCGNKWYCR